MVLDMRENMLMAKNMEGENSIELMVVYTIDIFVTIIFMDMEFMLGVMEENLLENEKITKWMVEEL